ncbi:hypothetical protein L9F63_002539 [Diploptera punctata]|uniref:CD80-like immunoglobulin C2-set domain-containing protein n=1 Tax=Diploptera punctata TaxID=6984 RepID=A0AAD7ZTQ3_DIPPU|nr:hypothetical protein L9F63_002539 [Diploptera punctata]
MAQSNQHQVMLESIQLNSTGMYLCEVSTEAPFFHTVSGHGTLTVIAPPLKQLPHIWGLRGLYEEGNVVNINCTSPPSKIASIIIWYVNGRQAETNLLVHYGVMVDKSASLKITVLGLRLTATKETFPNRILKLKCVAELGDEQQEQNRWTFLINKQKPSHGEKMQCWVWLLLAMGIVLLYVGD